MFLNSSNVGSSSPPLARRKLTTSVDERTEASIEGGVAVLNCVNSTFIDVISPADTLFDKPPPCL